MKDSDLALILQFDSRNSSSSHAQFALTSCSRFTATRNYMYNLGLSLLSVFDVSEDARDFLASLIESDVAPAEETQCLLEQSLLGGAEAWYSLIECARSLQQAQRHRLGDLDGHDLLAFIWAMLNDPYDGIPRPARPWEETDRLIDQARKLERDVETRPPTSPAKRKHTSKPACLSSRIKRRRSQGIYSHYWSDESFKQGQRDPTIDWKSTKSRTTILPIKFRASCPYPYARHEQGTEQGAHTTSTGLECYPGILAPLDCASGGCEQPAGVPAWYGSCTGGESITRKKQPAESPYFLRPELKQKGSPRIRPLPGTVSCIPFPPLTAPRFGLIQEELAHEPFWLLIAITFLIKTNGKLAIPAFYKVKERFPTFADLLNVDNEQELLDMIQHLGLSKVRLGYIHRYARAFLEQPPKAGVRHRVRNYDRRDMSPASQLSLSSLSSSTSSSSSSSSSLGNVGNEHQIVGSDGMQELEAWEIGHMTQGKYAMDSWRIFCRDELLGRATDWNGQGREPEFQPEWMRTRPDDKELRACLLWMWMREGWEWDPATGERTVLREEMRRAVNQGRVEYDETGALRILEH